PEWPKGADCKSVVDDFGGSNPPAPTSPERSCRWHGLFSLAGTDPGTEETENNPSCRRIFAQSTISPIQFRKNKVMLYLY
ncbi:MAG: hypothetical protein K2O84_03175, partial [Oscillospiraceae bacterium]|nr:hypothetical protein [Oscillospiraceae bacterium]